MPILFRSFIDALLDFVYPPKCISCERLLCRGQDHVCPECWASIRQVSTGLPLFLETRDKLLVTGTVDELVSLYVFEKEGHFQKIVHSLKYSGVQAVGLEIGRQLGALLNEKGVWADALVPIPLHKRKLRERGYNQAELIARGISGVTHIPLSSDMIRRKKFTQTQTTLSLEERRNNMEEAFFCESSEVREKTVILVDDIITTGSTIQSCAGALKKAGALRIIAVSAALAE